MLYILADRTKRLTPPVVSGPPPSNVPPTVNILGSVNFGSLTTPATVKLTAVASDTDGYPVSISWRSDSGGGPVEFANQQGVFTKNVALDQNGGVASSSVPESSLSGGNAINGNRTGLVNGVPSWYQTTGSSVLQIDFNTVAVPGSPQGGNPGVPSTPATYAITAVNLFFVQDNYLNPVTPTLSTVGHLYQLTSWILEYKDPTSGNWLPLPGGSIQNNTNIWRRIGVSQPINANGLRVNCTGSPDAWMRIVEVEVEVASAPTIGQETAFETTKIFGTAGVYTVDAQVTDNAGGVGTSNTLTFRVVDPVVVTGSLRSAHAETQLRDMAKAGQIPGVRYWECSQPDLLDFNGGLSNVDQQHFNVGGTIQAYTTFPDQYGPDTKFAYVWNVSHDVAAGSPAGAFFYAAYTTHMRHVIPNNCQAGWLNHTLRFEQDCVDHTLDIGWKLPGYEAANGGPAGAFFSLRTHNQGPKFDTTPASYIGDTYEFRPDIPGSEDSVYSPAARYIVGQFHSLDVWVKLNTPVNPATIVADVDAILSAANPDYNALAALWNFDGEREIWFDDVLVHKATNVFWRAHYRGVIDNIDFIMFNGGGPLASGEMHMYFGPIVFALDYANRPGMLRNVNVITPPPVQATPDGQHVTTNVQANGDLWTLGTAGTGGFQTLRNSQWTGQGFGVAYETWKGTLYLLNDAGDWFKWTSTTWSPFGRTDPSQASTGGGGVVVQPPPPPIPIGNGRLPSSGPLFAAGIPSAPGPHIAQIQAMAAGTWLDLGEPAGDPVWGVCEGRSWHGKIEYSSELGIAIRSAQGPHGQITARNGHNYYDSIVAYDAYGHRWIMLEPGVNTDTFAADVASGAIAVTPIEQFGDHWLVYTATGRPVYAAGAHLYQHATFDSLRLTYNCIGWHNGQGGGQFDSGNSGTPGGWYDPTTFATLAAQPGARSPNFWFYVYECLTGVMRKFPNAGDLYIPSIDKNFQYYNGPGAGGGGGTYLDSAHQTPAGAGLLDAAQGVSGNDRSVVYDPGRNRVYMGNNNYLNHQVYVYDVATNTWTDPTLNRGVGYMLPNDQGSAVFDIHADRLLSFGNSIDAVNRMSVWDPNTQGWESFATITVPDLSVKKSGSGAWYAPELKVTFYHHVTDGAFNGHIWVYKHKA